MSFSESEPTRRIVWSALHQIDDDAIRVGAVDAFTEIVSRLAFLELELDRIARRDTLRDLPAVRFGSSFPPPALVSVPDEISFCDGDGHVVKAST